MLFSKLDTANDGLLDEFELDALFSGVSGKGDVTGDNYLEDTE